MLRLEKKAHPSWYLPSPDLIRCRRTLIFPTCLSLFVSCQIKPVLTLLQNRPCTYLLLSRSNYEISCVNEVSKQFEITCYKSKETICMTKDGSN